MINFTETVTKPDRTQPGRLERATAKRRCALDARPLHLHAENEILPTLRSEAAVGKLKGRSSKKILRNLHEIFSLKLQRNETFQFIFSYSLKYSSFH